MKNEYDILIIGGGMANTFLAAQGYNVQSSLCEPDLAAGAREVLAKAEQQGCQIHLPVDVVAAERFAANTAHSTVGVDAVPENTMILDFGPQSLAQIESVIEQSQTLIWNGPVGAFEMKPFDKVTMAIAHIVARQTAKGALTSIAGGGDTVAALNQSGYANDISYISTAGGAFLEWMEGKVLPGIAALEKSAAANHNEIQ